MALEKTQCPGCGATLQSEDKHAPGFVPASTVLDEQVKCRRCFRITNYNEASSVTIDDDDFLRLLNTIGATKSLVVLMVDILDFEGSLISSLHRFVGDNSVILVVNKLDLLPKVTNWNRIVHWVKKQAKEHGLKVQEVVCISARRNMGVDRLLETIESHRDGRDVYVVGATNVGKTSMINRLIRDYSDLDRELTVSAYPGTTLDRIEIPLDDGSSIMDMPGIVYKHRLSELAPKATLKALLPEKPLKPAVYQLKAAQTLFFSSFARFDFVSGADQSFTLYSSTAIKIHRTKLENADDLFVKHRGVLLAPPTAEQLDEMPAWTKHDLQIPKGGHYDISISGLGWIKVNSDAGARVMVHAPRGVKVTVRDSII
jgi:ribosome biogenesis GTPase YqeH